MLSRLLKESWSLVEDRADEVAGYFYARLFLVNPRLRDQFPIQMDGQRQRLVDAVRYVLHAIDDPLGLDDRRDLDGSGQPSVPEDDAEARQCLIEAMRAYAGTAWASEYDRAWRAAYGTLVRRLAAGTGEEAGADGFRHAEVLTHERRSADVAVFTCRPQQPLSYQAGQYVSIETPYHPRLWRAYAMANAPRGDGVLEFHVRAVGAGWVSSALVWKLRPGDVVRLGPPRGAMLLDQQSGRDIVCVADGTGLAPMKGLIEEFGRINRVRWVHLFWGARREDDLYDLPALRSMTGRYPWLSVIPVVSEEPRYAGERGHVADAVVRYSPWPEHDFYVSGSPAMVRTTLTRLAELAIPAPRVRYQPFGEL